MTKIKLVVIVLAMAATFLLGARPAHAIDPVCPPGQHLWCFGGGDGNPWICYCAPNP